MTPTRSDVAALRDEHDIVAARQLVRTLTQELEFSLIDQTKIVTATSELARNTVKHGLGGEMRWEVGRRRRSERRPAQLRRPGPGIPDIERALTDGFHDRQRPWYGALGRATPRERLRHREHARQGHARHDHALEMRAPAQTVCQVSDESTVGAARRCAARIAVSAGLSETDKGRLGIVVTELARNITLHSGHGSLLMQELRDGDASGVEVLAVDCGPGIADLDRCLSDGYSHRRHARQRHGGGASAV